MKILSKYYIPRCRYIVLRAPCLDRIDSQDALGSRPIDDIIHLLRCYNSACLYINCVMGIPLGAAAQT